MNVDFRSYCNLASCFRFIKSNLRHVERIRRNYESVTKFSNAHFNPYIDSLYSLALDCYSIYEFETLLIEVKPKIIDYLSNSKNKTIIKIILDLYSQVWSLRFKL